MISCQHCGDVIETQRCSLCGESLRRLRQCAVCHQELRHDVITNQNIHLCGNPRMSANGGDGDPDMFGLAQ